MGHELAADNVDPKHKKVSFGGRYFSNGADFTHPGSVSQMNPRSILKVHPGSTNNASSASHSLSPNAVYMTVNIESLKCGVLVDTGATYSLVDETFVVKTLCKGGDIIRHCRKPHMEARARLCTL